MFANHVVALEPATVAFVQNLPAFLRVVPQAYWLHNAKASACPIARFNINVYGMQAKRTMISVAAAGCRQHFFFAVRARKPRVFFFLAQLNHLWYNSIHVFPKISNKYLEGAVLWQNLYLKPQT